MGAQPKGLHFVRGLLALETTVRTMSTLENACVHAMRVCI